MSLSCTARPVIGSSSRNRCQSLPPSLTPYATSRPSPLTVRVVSELVPSAENVFGSTRIRPPASSSAKESATYQTS